MARLKRSWIWIGPLIILLVGVFILFVENYQEVTGPPSEEWSREIELGTLSSNIQPHVSEMSNSTLSISYATKKGVQQKILSDTNQVIAKHTYDIPYNKWTETYVKNDHVLYFDYYAIYDGKTKEKITDASRFIPLKNNVVYQQGLEIFIMNPETKTSSSLLTLPDDNVEFSMYEADSQIYLMTQKTDTSGIDITFYQVKQTTVSKLAETQFQTKPSEVAKSIQFTIEDHQYSLFLQTFQKQSMSGKPVSHYYYSKQPLDEKPQLESITFSDPAANQALSEISDFEIGTENGQTVLLFKGYGFTKTGYREDGQFNIYQAIINEQGKSTTTRLSNTPDSSSQPERINEDAIIWVDGQGDTNRLLLASSHPEVIEQAQQVSGEYLLGALGKTVGMLSYSFFAVIVGLIWYIWPLIFLAVMMFSSNKAYDKDQEWVFFLGAFIYLGAAILFKDRIYTPSLLSRAPEYLSFTGSSIVYTLVFALVIYAIMQLSKRDWSITVRLSYFVGVHLLFVTIFYGPYLI
ncbi:hypothetical protein [Halobacillus naozhouensis]|uniref:Uncharacterized protein n=1 Tax=Halobacillus naozhouensis TaxID=554880 RepID=A0ABY8IU38_9BACI|nr:hypothetical protein [Halobacillus naozhouensis]WFT73590.1 hypothetical protein P9989_14555 [Halobacillus naozhouensis]